MDTGGVGPGGDLAGSSETDNILKLRLRSVGPLLLVGGECKENLPSAGYDLKETFAQPRNLLL